MTLRGSDNISLKRVYEPAAPSDGCRVLVDRLWPRGLARDAAGLDAWFKDMAPSAELRRWYGHDRSKWASFKRRYWRELDRRESCLDPLLGLCSEGTVTLLFATKDLEHNNAVALKEYLDRRLDPKRRR